MRPLHALYALVATFGLVFLAAPASAAAGPTQAGPDCAPEPCGTVNTICWKAFHVNCVRALETVQAPADARCMGPVCDAVNAVCYTVLKQWCLG